jgi:outer membrane biosynthesis protein TonB
MKMKSLLALVTGLTLFWGGLTLPAYSQGSSAGQAFPVDPDGSALMLRKGKESFSRARYGEAREYFRKAIQADPHSQKAWSYYDLAQLYTVAEQFKNHGRIVASTAPPPEQTAEPAPAPPAPPMAPGAPAKEKAAPIPEKAAPVKEKAAPAKTEKPAATAPKEKAASPEVKKPVEPTKPTVSAPAAPATPAAPAAPPAAPPTPTKPPGGAKIMHDEGC